MQTTINVGLVFLLFIAVLIVACTSGEQSADDWSPYPIQQRKGALCKQFSLPELTAYTSQCEDLLTRSSTINDGRALPLSPTDFKLLSPCMRLQKDGCIMCVAAPPEIVEKPKLNIRTAHKCTVLDQP